MHCALLPHGSCFMQAFNSNALLPFPYLHPACCPDPPKGPPFAHVSHLPAVAVMRLHHVL